MSIVFAAAMAATLLFGRGIHEAANGIVTNTTPSVSRIASLRTELRHLEIVLDDAVERRLMGQPMEADVGAVEDARRAITRAWSGYRALPTFPAAATLHADVEAKLARVSTAADVALHEARASAADAALERTKIAADELDATLVRLRNVESAESARLARDIRQSWEHSLAAAVVAVVLVIAITLMTALSLARMVRHIAHEAEERADELEAFAGRVAHDLVNPLTASVMTLSVLREQHPGDAALARRLERLGAMLSRAGALVQDLYEYAAAGGHCDRDARADVSDILRDVVAVQGAAAARLDADIVVDQPLPAEVACRPGVLVSIMANLIDNALKHMGDAGQRRVAVHVRDADEHVRIEVEDSGPGIPPEQLPRLFDPYTRGDHSTPGLGLGLATVKRLAESHGGVVGVRSTPGFGSTFWLELPKAAARSTARG